MLYLPGKLRIGIVKNGGTVGNYRVIYEPINNDQEKKIVVLPIEHLKDVYR